MSGSNSRTSPAKHISHKPSILKLLYTRGHDTTQYGEPNAMDNSTNATRLNMNAALYTILFPSMTILAGVYNIVRGVPVLVSLQNTHAAS